MAKQQKTERLYWSAVIWITLFVQFFIIVDKLETPLREPQQKSSDSQNSNRWVPTMSRTIH
ncbi:hypothetical protein HY450_02335 [Candidatus Pacearchaeota archaeon]|nr:hypothetical protein [Candidatus Pacearchaeota archaeon]